MNDLNPFEKDIKQTYRLPDTNPAFFNNLEAKLQAHQLNPETKANPTFHFTRGWAYAVATLIFNNRHGNCHRSFKGPGADTDCLRIRTGCWPCEY